MDKMDRRTALFGALTALLGSPVVGAKDAKATTVLLLGRLTRLEP
jgi:hypothetical protein